MLLRTHSPYSRQTAFTLVELVALLAVTTLIVAVAVSGYRTYYVRAEIATVIEATHDMRAAIAAAFKREGEVPAEWPTESAFGSSAVRLHPFVAAVAVDSGRIDITFGNRAAQEIVGRKLSFTPYETVDLGIVWVCGNEIPGLGLKPLGFSSGGRQTVQIPTTVESRYLPASCR